MKGGPAARITRNFFLHIHDARVHPHSLRPGYTFGLGIILGCLFLIMLLTGALLLVYYTPSVEGAYGSVKDIIHVVPGGRIIRNMHRWAGQSMIIVALLHMVRVFYTGGYLGGRSRNWVIGVVLLILILLSNFSGYLLPWDQLAYWAVTIGSNIAASAREFTDTTGITSFFDPGGFLKKLLIGGETVGQPALSRFFAFHVIFLPLTTLVLCAIHFWRIRKDGGLSRPAREREPGSREKWYAWPVLMWTELALLVGVLSLVMLFALVADAPLLERANPSFPENPAKSPWYFLGIQELVSHSAFAGGMVIPLLFLVFLFSIPYLDREAHYEGKWFSGSVGTRVFLYSALFSFSVVLVLLFITVRLGDVRSWWPRAPAWMGMILNPATVAGILYILAAEWARKRHRSSRMGAMALFTCLLVALILFTAIGTWFRGPDWVFYWSHSNWPIP